MEQRSGPQLRQQTIEALRGDRRRCGGDVAVELGRRPAEPEGHERGESAGAGRQPEQQLDPLWDELFPAEQARIVALLVERVDIGADGLNVRLRVDGLSGLAREMLAGDIGAAA